MLIYADGRTVLEHADEVSLEPIQEMLLRSAARTVPATHPELMVAAQVLVHVIREGMVDEPNVALKHAIAILHAVDARKDDATILRHIREIVPLCRFLDDDRPLLAVSSIMEGLRPHVLHPSQKGAPC